MTATHAGRSGKNPAKTRNIHSPRTVGIALVLCGFCLFGLVYSVSQPNMAAAQPIEGADEPAETTAPEDATGGETTAPEGTEGTTGGDAAAPVGDKDGNCEPVEGGGTAPEGTTAPGETTAPEATQQARHSSYAHEEGHAEETPTPEETTAPDGDTSGGGTTAPNGDTSGGGGGTAPEDPDCEGVGDTGDQDGSSCSLTNIKGCIREALLTMWTYFWDKVVMVGMSEAGETVEGSAFGLPDPSGEVKDLFDRAAGIVKPGVLVGLLLLSLMMTLRSANYDVHYATQIGLPNLALVAGGLAFFPELMSLVSGLAGSLAEEFMGEAELAGAVSSLTSGEDSKGAGVLYAIMTIALIIALVVLACMALMKNVLFSILFIAGPFALILYPIPGLSQITGAWFRGIVATTAVTLIFTIEVVIGTWLIESPEMILGTNTELPIFSTIIALVLLYIMIKTPFKVLNWAFQGFGSGGGIRSTFKHAMSSWASGQIKGMMPDFTGKGRDQGTSDKAGAGDLQKPNNTRDLKQQTDGAYAAMGVSEDDKNSQQRDIAQDLGVGDTKRAGLRDQSEDAGSNADFIRNQADEAENKSATGLHAETDASAENGTEDPAENASDLNEQRSYPTEPVANTDADADAGNQAAGAQVAGAQDDGAQAVGAQEASAQDAGVQTMGTQEAGVQAAEAQQAAENEGADANLGGYRAEVEHEALAAATGASNEAYANEQDRYAAETPQSAGKEARASYDEDQAASASNAGSVAALQTYTNTAAKGGASSYKGRYGARHAPPSLAAGQTMAARSGTKNPVAEQKAVRAGLQSAALGKGQIEAKASQAYQNAFKTEVANGAGPGITSGAYAAGEQAYQQAYQAETSQVFDHAYQQAGGTYPWRSAPGGGEGGGGETSGTGGGGGAYGSADPVAAQSPSNHYLGMGSVPSVAAATVAAGAAPSGGGRDAAPPLYTQSQQPQTAPISSETPPSVPGGNSSPGGPAPVQDRDAQPPAFRPPETARTPTGQTGRLLRPDAPVHPNPDGAPAGGGGAPDTTQAPPPGGDVGETRNYGPGARGPR